jgi:ABC-type phosphate transport system substrate-binding protein
MGEIAWWNDTRLSIDNPGVQLPNEPITVVARQDGSGTTEIFTQALAKFYPGFKARIGGRAACKGISDCHWPPSFTLAAGNSGVSLTVATTPNSIGYVVLGQAIGDELFTAQVVNRAGVAVTANPTSVAFAVQELGGIFQNGRLTADITDPFSSLAWPISGYTYLIMRKETQKAGSTCAARSEVLLFWRWFMLSEALRDGAGRLGFATLSQFVRERVLGQLLADTKCADGSLAYTGADSKVQVVNLVGVQALRSLFRTTIGPTYMSVAPTVTVEYIPALSSALLLHELSKFGQGAARIAAAVVVGETLSAAILRPSKAAPEFPALGLPTALDFHVKPMATVGISIVFNLAAAKSVNFWGESSKSPQMLTLRPRVLVDILLGDISHWDAPGIIETNPGAANVLQHTSISLVIPGYACDANTVFSATLARLSPKFATFLLSVAGASLDGTPNPSIWLGSKARIHRESTNYAEQVAILQQTEGALSFVLQEGPTSADFIALTVTPEEYHSGLLNLPSFSSDDEAHALSTPLSTAVTSEGNYVIFPSPGSIAACAVGNTTSSVTGKLVSWNSLVPLSRVVSGFDRPMMSFTSPDAGWLVDFSNAPGGSCWPLSTAVYAVSMRSYRANDTVGAGESIIQSELPAASRQGAVLSCTTIGVVERFMAWLYDSRISPTPLQQLTSPLGSRQSESVRRAILTGVTCGGIPVNRLDVICAVGEKLILEPTPVCVPCPTGTYSLDNRGVCSPCPAGATCAGGSHLGALPGFWQGNSDQEFYECSPTTACCSLALQDVAENGQPLGCGQTSIGRCSEGRIASSTLCGVCSAGFSYVGSLCVQCDGPNVPILVLLVTLSLLLVAALLFVQQRYSFKENSFQILIAFYQMAALLVTPEQAEQSGLALVTLNLSPVAEIKGLNCLFPMSAELAAFLPVILALLFLIEVAALMGVESLYRLAVSGSMSETTVATETVNSMSWATKYGVLAWRVALLSFTAVVLVSLQLFRCVQVDGVSVLTSYPAVRCDTPVHSGLLLMSSILLVILLLGMPLFITVVVRRQMVDLPHWSPQDLPFAARAVNQLIARIEDLLLSTVCRTAKSRALTAGGRRRVSQATWTPKLYTFKRPVDEAAPAAIVVCLPAVIDDARPASSEVTGELAPLGPSVNRGDNSVLQTVRSSKLKTTHLSRMAKVGPAANEDASVYYAGADLRIWDASGEETSASPAGIRRASTNGTQGSIQVVRHLTTRSQGSLAEHNYTRMILELQVVTVVLGLSRALHRSFLTRKPPVSLGRVSTSCVKQGLSVRSRPLQSMHL